MKNDKREHIILKTLDAIHLVKLSTILYCKSEGNYTTFYLEDERSILISKPLKFAVDLLSTEHFIRCHQSYIINTAFVRKIIKSGSVVLSNHSEIPVSGANKNKVFEQILSKMKL